MPELIEPPDGETLAIQYLAGLLPKQAGFESVGVFGALPPTSPDYGPPGEAVVVRGTGGTVRDLAVHEVQLTLTAWAGPEDDLRASEICRRAVALVLAAERSGWMAGSACSSVLLFAHPYIDPDPVTGRSRYSATLGVSLRGRVLRA